MDRRLGNRFDLEKDHSNHRRNDPIRHNGHFETVSSFGASTSNDQSRMHRPYTRDIGQEGYQPAQQYSSKSFVGSSPQWERAKSINDLPPPPHRMPPPTNFRQLTSAITSESTRSTTSEGRWPTRAAGSTGLHVSSRKESPQLHNKPKHETVSNTSNHSNEISNQLNSGLTVDDRASELVSTKKIIVHNQNLVEITTAMNAETVVRAAIDTSSISKGNSSSSPTGPFSSQYISSKPFASLFAKSNATDTMPDSSHTVSTGSENVINLLDESDFPAPIENHSVSVHHATSSYISTNEDSIDAPLRNVKFFSHNPDETKVKPKVLFDPDSNAFREFKGPDKDNSGKHSLLKNNKSIAQPSSRVNRSNKNGSTTANQSDEKDNGRWGKQSLPTDKFSNCAIIGVLTRDVIGSATNDTTLSRRAKTEEETSAQFILDSETDVLEGRQEVHNARKEQRQKERESRGPRTKGILYKYTADGDIERVLTLEEKNKSSVSKNKNKSQSSSFPSSSSDMRANSFTANDSTAEFPIRSFDVQEGIDKKKKKSRNGKPAMTKVDQGLSAIEEGSINGRKAYLCDINSSKISAFDVGDDVMKTFSSVLLPYTNIAGNGSGELDIQKVAMEAEANRSLQPIKSFIPGVGLSNIPESNTHQLAWTAPNSILESSIPPTSRSRVSESFGGLMQSSLLLDDGNPSW